MARAIPRPRALRDRGKTARLSGGPTPVVVAWLVVLACLPVAARELVPFPSQQQTQNAPVQQSAPVQAYLVEFDRSVRDLDCAHLNQVRNKLSQSQQSATINADQQYFAQLIRIVDDYRRQHRCRPAP
ncbi:MAG TPA: hypothetical protein VL742_17585 [Casimicrobiaceae bacterium]|nr:hypothetical protein [Casimicrobiaceae bacterium]